MFEASWFVYLAAARDRAFGIAFMAPDHPSQPPGPERFSGKGAFITIEVADAAAEFDRLAREGLAIAYALRDDPWGQRRFAVYDPSGTWELTVQRHMDGFHKSDHAQILSCLADDVEWVIPGMFHVVGKEAFDREIENEAFVGSPTIRITRLTEEDDVVVAEGSVRCARRDGGILNAVFCDVFALKEALDVVPDGAEGGPGGPRSPEAMNSATHRPPCLRKMSECKT